MRRTPIPYNKKYQILKDEKHVKTHDIHGVKLYQIQRLSDGAYGGFVESEDNLAQIGMCWITPGVNLLWGTQITGNVSIISEISADIVNSQLSGNKFITYDSAMYQIENNKQTPLMLNVDCIAPFIGFYLHNTLIHNCHFYLSSLINMPQVIWNSILHGIACYNNFNIRNTKLLNRGKPQNISYFSFPVNTLTLNNVVIDSHDFARVRALSVRAASASITDYISHFECINNSTLENTTMPEHVLHALMSGGSSDPIQIYHNYKRLVPEDTQVHKHKSRIPELTATRRLSISSSQKTTSKG